MTSTNGHGSADDDARDGIEPALTRSEYHLIATIFKISKWLAKYSRENVVNRCGRELGMTAAVAEKWIAKAEDYLALGCIEGMEDARKMYVARLNDIFHSCMGNLIADQVEVTKKPMKLKVVDQSDKVIGVQEVVGEITKVKVARFNPDAHALAFKISKEIAYIQGGRPADGPRQQINVQVNTSAQAIDGKMVSDLSNAQLVSKLGGELVEFEPQVKQAMEREVVEGEAEECE